MQGRALASALMRLNRFLFNRILKPKERHGKTLLTKKTGI